MREYMPSCQPEADMMANDSVINELRDFAEWIRRENRNRRTILKALETEGGQ
jgi:hypothetical protein